MLIEAQMATTRAELTASDSSALILPPAKYAANLLVQRQAAMAATPSAKQSHMDIADVDTTTDKASQSGRA